jgi:hypothetical protein
MGWTTEHTFQIEAAIFLFATTARGADNLTAICEPIVLKM